MNSIRSPKAVLVLFVLGISITTVYAIAPTGLMNTVVTVDADNMFVNGDYGSVDDLIDDPGDDGISFREALLAVNNSGPGYTILFDLPPCTTLFYDETLTLTAANTIIDGDTNNDSVPDIVFQSPNDKVWLLVTSDHNIFRHLIFKKLHLSGAGAHVNQIRNSYIGTNCTGILEDSFIGNGIEIRNGAHHNIIEDNIIAGNSNANPAQIEVSRTGIVMRGGAHHNEILGNRIGINKNGDPLPNNIGILIREGSHTNTIGGSRGGTACVNPCNIISGNYGTGIQIGYRDTQANSDNNLILGNYIGVGPDGNTAVPNGLLQGSSFQGIGIYDGSSGNVIGGERPDISCTGPCNVISGNDGHGIVVRGEDSDNNLIQGNYMGLNVAGTQEIPNGAAAFNGTNEEVNIPTVWIGRGASQNTVGGERAGTACNGFCNVISGNKATNVYIGGQFSGLETSRNAVIGNFIGVNPDSNDSMHNWSSGISITSGATESIIGGQLDSEICDGPCNVIGGHPLSGVYLAGIGTTDNDVLGNFIGTNKTGDAFLPNGSGVRIAFGASHNLIGGRRSDNVCDGPCNFIQSNTIGIELLHEATQHNNIEGNILKFNGTGMWVAAASHTTIGGRRFGTECNLACNVIGGSQFNGIEIEGNSNQITGNFIGVRADGTAAFPNRSGITLSGNAQNNTIGGKRDSIDCTGPCNVISGNTIHGIFFENAHNNDVKGNYIGLRPDGTAALPNGTNGIDLELSTHNLIGSHRLETSCRGACNVISGNVAAGIQMGSSSGNSILGNLIGLNPAGTAAIGNGGSGIEISGESSNNQLGGLREGLNCAGPCNVISGNQKAGIAFFAAAAAGNSVQGNYIGVDIGGVTAVPNGLSGIELGNGSMDNTIGGERSSTPCDGPCNVISGNTYAGILLATGANNNALQGNFIGVGADGQSSIPNNNGGVLLDPASQNNLIGGQRAVSNCLGSCNVIANNMVGGVIAQGNTTTGNAILGNVIHNNAGLGIDLNIDSVTANDSGDGDSGPNQLQNFPVLLSAVDVGGVTIEGLLDSTPNTIFRLEFYANDAADASGFGEGKHYLGAFHTTTDQFGQAHFIGPLPVSELLNTFITATATDPAGNTSEFSRAFPVGSSGPGFTVTATDDTDDGSCNLMHCSLREAILAANTNPGIDLIQFDITGSGPHLILPTAALPTITDQVVIDGSTEPDFSGTPIVVINGTGAGTAVNGLTITSAGSRIQGLVIQNFDGSAIFLSGADTNQIMGNYIGTEVDGSSDAGNRGDGIRVDGSSQNIIGGETGVSGNIIAFNGGNGVTIVNGIENVLNGNRIFSNVGLGIDLGDDGVTTNDDHDRDLGANALQNFPLLEYAISQPGQTTVAGLMRGEPNTTFQIDFFANDSCDDSDHGEGEIILGGTVVVTDEAGFAAFVAHPPVAAGPDSFVTAVALNLNTNNSSEFSHCVALLTADIVVNAINDLTDGFCDASHCSMREAINSANFSGDLTVIAFNISGDGDHTILLNDDLPLITAPLILDGTTEPGYLDTPIVSLVNSHGELGKGLEITAGDSTIRGLEIVVDEDAIRLIEGDGNLIERNVLYAEGLPGVYISDSSNNVIGGLLPHLGNVIEGGNSDVALDSIGLSLNNTIRGNQAANIDLGWDGPTLNDENDVDNGPNHLQNYPQIISINDKTTITRTVSFSLHSISNSNFFIDFYSIGGCSGEAYLATTTVQTDGSGNVEAEVVLSNGFCNDDYIIATATDSNGNTSEESPLFPSPIPPSFSNDPLNAPTHNQKSGNPPMFDWDDADQDVDYSLNIICYSGDVQTVIPCPWAPLRPTSENGVGPAIFSFTTQDSQFVPPFELPDGFYAWTVVATNKAGLISEPIRPEFFFIESEQILYLPAIFK